MRLDDQALARHAHDGALNFTAAKNAIAARDWRAVVQSNPYLQSAADVDRVAANNRGVELGGLVRAVAPTDLPRA